MEAAPLSCLSGKSHCLVDHSQVKSLWTVRLVLDTCNSSQGTEYS